VTSEGFLTGSALPKTPRYPIIIRMRITLSNLKHEQFKRQTWKNGLGFTDEISIHPETAELRRANFLWRISSARIEQASPFSVFPDHDRVIVILKGNGLRLTHTFDGDEDSTVLPLLAPYEFPGDVPSRCELVSGGVTDLSVFFRKGEVDALVEVVDGPVEGSNFSWRPSGRWNFAFAARGSFEVAATSVVEADTLDEGSALRVDLSEELTEEQVITFASNAASDGKLILISLQG